MKQVATNDGSVTFLEEELNEHYHSTSGAVDEAIRKYAEPCKISEFKYEVFILDICFGIGYNSAAAIDLFKGERINIVALEKDKKIIDKIQEINPSFKCWNIIQKAAKDLSYDDGKVSIRIILGDARETIKSVKEKFDCVFLDPFSPKNCPELWTEEFFKDIVKAMKKVSVLATYSCANRVRKNLMNAGLSVFDGPCVGRRSPSTVAKL